MQNAHLVVKITRRFSHPEGQGQSPFYGHKIYLAMPFWLLWTGLKLIPLITKNMANIHFLCKQVTTKVVPRILEFLLQFLVKNLILTVKYLEQNDQIHTVTVVNISILWGHFYFLQFSEGKKKQKTKTSIKKNKWKKEETKNAEFGVRLLFSEKKDLQSWPHRSWKYFLWITPWRLHFILYLSQKVSSTASNKIHI